MSYGRRAPIGSLAREREDRRAADLRHRLRHRRLCRCGSGKFEDLIDAGTCIACHPATRDLYVQWLHKGSKQ